MLKLASYTAVTAYCSARVQVQHPGQGQCAMQHHPGLPIHLQLFPLIQIYLKPQSLARPSYDLLCPSLISAFLIVFFSNWDFEVRWKVLFRYQSQWARTSQYILTTVTLITPIQILSCFIFNYIRVKEPGKENLDVRNCVIMSIEKWHKHKVR